MCLSHYYEYKNGVYVYLLAIVGSGSINAKYYDKETEAGKLNKATGTCSFLWRISRASKKKSLRCKSGSVFTLLRTLGNQTILCFLVILVVYLA